MNILIVNTSERTGGAAIAAQRIAKAIRTTKGQDVKVTFLSAERGLKAKLRKALECLVVFIHNGFSKNNMFSISIANTGTDITKTKEFKDADVVHLHWINQGMLSLDVIRKILQSGKPVVWTMHDMWPFTSVCHNTTTCTQFHSRCQHCGLFDHKPILPFMKDLTTRVFDKKSKVYSSAKITFVGCSRWISNQASRSTLTKGHKIISIPNTLDTDIFAPGNKIEARKGLNLPLEKYLILFSSRRVTDLSKGINYLYEAILLMLNQYPELRERIGLVVLGGKAEETKNGQTDVIQRISHYIDYTSSETKLSEIYNAVDMYVTPSLQDNLPNTIMEALACGVPCVGFSTGGIPEMIDHKLNGYVAQYADTEDLKNGIYWTMQHTDSEHLKTHARQKVLDTYAPAIIASQYYETYLSLFVSV